MMIHPPVKHVLASWSANVLMGLLVVLTASFGGPLAAQDGDVTDVFPQVTFANSGAPSNSEPSQWTAVYQIDPQTGKGQIEVATELADKWHVYSTTQAPGGPRTTVLSIASPDTVKLTGDFEPDQEPKQSVSSVYKGLTIEEHEESVTWTAPITAPLGYEGPIEVTVAALVCKSDDGRCLPVDETVVATARNAQESKAASAQVAALQSAASEGVSNATAMESDTDVDASEPEIERSFGLPMGSKFGSPFGLQPSMSSDFMSLANDEADGPTPFRDGDYVVSWTASVEPAQVKPGGAAVLKFTATPDQSFHVYKAVTDDAESSTNFVITEKSALKVGAPQANQPVISKVLIKSLPAIEYHEGKVTWSLPIQVPADAAAGPKTIAGLIAYQACTDSSCHRPMALSFTTAINVGTGNDATGEVTMAPAKYAKVMDAAAESKWVDTDVDVDVQSSTERAVDQDDIASVGGSGTISSSGSGDAGEPKSTSVTPLVASEGQSGLLFVLASAFLGGIVLNFMPCVLPVIGLKVMSFVSQAGENRKRVLTLNLAYAAGIFSVFALLAVLAIVFQFKWGQQFQYFPIRLGVTVALFAFALSYFNVWEIPVPGLASGKRSQELQSQEGHTGAFSKGIFTTLLATPCSGPLLGGVFGATLGMPPVQILLVFGMLALGMSSPYLLLGFKPELARFLPKPGDWMETFKQLMAFLFLAAVCYFFYQFSDDNKLSVFVTLMGVWFGCWIIGLVPNWAAIQKRLLAWGSGISIATAIGIFAFTSLKATPELPWVDYDEQSFVEYQADGKTVLVDFSAKWCPNCLVNLEVAIDTKPVRAVIDELGIVPMYADWTNYDPEITAKLEELQSNSIPVLAIYPADRPNEPIILRDLVSQSTVLAALKEAGPSKQRSRRAEVGQVSSSDQSLVNRRKIASSDSSH
ncbi:protein-disulfide reductase DsbD family protein [Rubripirellula amarantea]|nr:protein-disulfide reductase DsbD family protein [Rubripirellula amarantea]